MATDRASDGASDRVDVPVGEQRGVAAAVAGRRGRPRSESAERSIVDAVVHLLEEGVPFSGLSIERIARTAGVGKATIYRRWAGKEALFVDVVRSIEPDDPPLPGTSVRDDLVALVETLRRRGLAKRSSALLHNVFAQMRSHPKLWDMYHVTSVQPRREQMEAVLRRGIATGEIRPDLDVELLSDLFSGPMLVRTVLRPEGTPEAGSSERIVDAVLRGVGTGAGAGTGTGTGTGRGTGTGTGRGTGTGEGVAPDGGTDAGVPH